MWPSALTTNPEPVDRFFTGSCGVGPVLAKVRFAARIAISRPSDILPVTGRPIFDTVRLAEIDRIYASPVAAADRVYFTGRDGTTVVIQPGDELKVLAVNHLDDPMDASPAIVGRQMFLRGRKYLYCLEEK